MGKQSKRTRKFESKGGVKAGLEKGTITCKGKLKRRGKKRKASAEDNSTKRANAASNEHERMEQLKRVENDFTSKENLGDLDLESFFEKTVNELSEKLSDQTDENISTGDQKRNESKTNDSDQSKTPKSRTEKEEDDDENSDSDSDGSESDSDDDVDAAAERMEREMNKLGNTDPEFKKFLQENEEALLDFEAEESSEEEELAQEEVNDKNKEGFVEVTNSFLDKIEHGTFKSHGIKPLKKLISVYKSACHMFDSDQSSGSSKGKVYHIESSKLFDRVMMITLTQCHREFSYHLLGDGSQDSNKEEKSGDGEDEQLDSDIDEGTPIHPKKILRSNRWVEIRGTLQSFFKSTINMLMEGKDPEHLTFILKTLGKYIPFLTPMPIMAQNLLRTLTSIWSAPLDSSVDYQVVRLNAFIRIRQMAITQPYPFIEDCLKKTYLAYAKRAKFGTSATVTSVLPTLTFMGNCIVELYSLDFHSSYQHAFIYIRQLALHLRAAIQKKTPEALQVVYCWQYIHCLKLWTAVLAQSCKMSLSIETSNSSDAKLLVSLIYPLTEIIQGVIRLVPTTRHLPLRLHCVRYLQQLAGASEKFIPTTAVLLEALELKEITMKPKRDKSREASRGIKLPLIIKLPKQDTLRTYEQLEACVSEIFLLLNREVDLYRYSPGFPEFTMLICQRLRKLNKVTQNGRWRAYAKGCIDLCEKYAQSAKSERSKLKEAPKDIKRLEALKPVSAPTMGERYEAAIAKEKRLEEVARPAMKAKKVKKRKKLLQGEEADGKDIKKLSGDKAKKEKKVEKLLSAKEALAQEDEVAEGIDWSDEEPNDEDSSNSMSE